MDRDYKRNLEIDRERNNVFDLLEDLKANLNNINESEIADYLEDLSSMLSNFISAKNN